MISGKVEGDERVIVRIKAIPDNVRARLKEAVTRLANDLQGYIVKNKLSGQVLHRRSGNLARSIMPNVIETDTAIIGIVASHPMEGKPLKYAAYHEYGLDTIGHRSLKLPSHLVKRKRGEIVMTGSPYGIYLPERSFMRSSLAENETKIKAAIAKAISDGVKAK